MKLFIRAAFACIVISMSGMLVHPASGQEKVNLKMGSWRTDDAPQMNRILDRFHAKHPNISIIFDPTPPSEYDSVLKTQLENKGGPDLFYLRSYSIGRQLYEAGHCASLNGLPGLKKNFTPAMREPWATDKNISYGLPFIATSHGIYYNKTVFKQLGLAPPSEWNELMRMADTIQKTGLTPFANASGDAWTMNEIVLMNLMPNFIGGREGRKAYLAGRRCFNDEHITAAFEAVKELAPFFPKNHPFFMYADSLQLFVQGKAAMWMGGSWDIPFFEAEKPDFEWSVFAVPPTEGRVPYVTFHLDAGMGLNAHSAYQKEAKLFLEWMTTQEFAELLGNELPGFFPMHSRVPKLKNIHANAFLNLNNGRETDIRFAWEKIREGSPDAYTLLQTGVMAVLDGSWTPKQAADSLQNGLAEWFKPAMTCSQ